MRLTGSMGSSDCIVVPQSSSSPAEMISAYRDRFAEMERVYCALFQRMETHMDGLLDLSLSVAQKNEIILSAEYMLVGIRSKLLSELSSLNTAIAATRHGGLHNLFKERKDVVLQYMQRLSDLRTDVDVLQRTRYNESWRK